MSKPVVTLYQRAGKHQLAGLSVVPVDPGHLTVDGAALVKAHLGAPKAGDRVRLGDGSWWTVQGAGEPNGGVYTVTVTSGGA